MVKKNILCALCAALVMLLLPWCAVTFVKGNGGMAACFILFFAVDPTAAVCSGVFAGWRPGASWFQPIALSALFVLGCWIFFEFGDPAFLLYAGIYLLLGYLAMAVTVLLRRNLAPSRLKVN